MKKQLGPTCPSRRQFLSIGAAGMLALTAGGNVHAQKIRKRLMRRRTPAVHTEKRGKPAVVVGKNEHRYEVQHD